MTTRDEVMRHRRSGPWRALQQTAQVIVADAQRMGGGSPLHARLGGGTRLMLALEHRISDDIDLFIRDPQWLGYLSPRLNERVEAMTSDYQESADFLKLRMPEGEIDFIVRGSLLGGVDESAAEASFPLEPVAEVLAKKLFYRGHVLQPRDLFDWWAIETLKPELVPEADLGRLLKSRQVDIRAALDAIARSPRADTLWSQIRAPDKPDLVSTAAWAQTRLSDYGRNAV